MSWSDGDARAFGQHVRSCRHARGLTQEALAEASGLSADTIRRLEHADFSPSLRTLSKLCRGLNMAMSTLFDSFELRDHDLVRQIVDIVMEMEPRTRRAVLRILPLIRDLDLVLGKDTDDDE